MKGYLSDEEWDEIVALDYILTWGFYKDDILKYHLERYKQLVNKRYNG